MPGFFLSARFVDRVVFALHADDEERADAMRAIGPSIVLPHSFFGTRLQVDARAQRKMPRYLVSSGASSSLAACFWLLDLGSNQGPTD